MSQYYWQGMPDVQGLLAGAARVPVFLAWGQISWDAKFPVTTYDIYPFREFLLYMVLLQ